MRSLGRTATKRAAAALLPAGGRRLLAVRVLARKTVSSKTQPGAGAQGFTQSDNSGKSNIFPSASKAYYRSPTSESVASSGLGGSQGLGVIAAALVIVAVAMAGVIGKQDAEQAQGADGYSGEPLSVIAKRLSGSP